MATSNSTGKTLIKAGAIVSIVFGSIALLFVLPFALIGIFSGSGVAASAFLFIALLASLPLILGIVQLTVKKIKPGGHLALGIINLFMLQWISGILIIIGAAMEMNNKN